MKLSAVRKLLSSWGAYWARQELGASYASISTTGQVCEIARVGIQARGTGIDVSHLADAMHVPESLSELDSAISKLNNQEVSAIRQKYILRKSLDNLYIRNAEIYLSNVL